MRCWVWVGGGKGKEMGGRVDGEGIKGGRKRGLASFAVGQQ